MGGSGIVVLRPSICENDNDMSGTLHEFQAVGVNCISEIECAFYTYHRKYDTAHGKESSNSGVSIEYHGEHK